MESLIGLALLWILWLVTSRRWRRRLMLPILAIALGIVLTSPAALAVGQWGMTLALPRDSGASADAIVVLGRGPELRDSRTAKAWELWQARRAPQIFASGMLDARFITQTLKEIGIPEGRVAGEECSQSTQENALFTAAILHPKNEETILLVTDIPHMMRALLIFQQSGFQVIPVAVELPAQMPHFAKLNVLVREFFLLIRERLTGVDNAPAPEDLVEPPVAIYQKMQEWGCTDMQ